MLAEFDPAGVYFRKYPFPAATIYPQGRVFYSEIRDCDPCACPPEVRTFVGETLFVSAEQREEFRAAMKLAGVRVERSLDVWGLLLEPFLDTEHSPAWERRCLEQLAEGGFSRQETVAIRSQVGPMMMVDNSIQWEWIHLGLFDLLTAARHALCWDSFRYWISPRSYREFYRWAMEIAERGRR